MPLPKNAEENMSATVIETTNTKTDSGTRRELNWNTMRRSTRYGLYFYLIGFVTNNICNTYINGKRRLTVYGELEEKMKNNPSDIKYLDAISDRYSKIRWNVFWDSFLWPTYIFEHVVPSIVLFFNKKRL